MAATALARRAAVTPPHLQPNGSSSTWQLVGQLLSARATWDRNHGQTPPKHVDCIACAVLEQPCPRCSTATTPADRPAAPGGPPPCLGCGLPLHQVFVVEGSDVHPTWYAEQATADPVAQQLQLGPSAGGLVSFAIGHDGSATTFTTAGLRVPVLVRVPDTTDSTVLVPLAAVLLNTDR